MSHSDSTPIQGTINIAGTPTVTVTGSVATTVPTGTQTVVVAGTATVTIVGGSTSNPAAGATGAAVPADASYTGFSSGGNLVGVSAVNPLPISGTFSAPTGTQTVEVAGIVGTSTVQVAGISAGTVAVAGVVEVGPTGAANTRINPFFNEITDGTNVMGTMVAFGSNPGAALALNVNAAIQQGTVAVAGTSTVEVAGIVGTSTVTVAGAVTAACTGTQTVTVSGNVSIGGTSTVEVAGIVGTSTVTIAGNVSVAGTSTVQVAGISGGTVQVSGVVGTSTVQIAGISAGTVQIAGTVTAACTGTQTVTVSGNVTIGGTSTVEVAGIVGTSTVQIAGISAGTVAVAGTSTVALSGQVAGPVAAGTAASSSILDGLVYNTAVPVLTNGQQAAQQGDSAANLRVNPFGNVGAFTSATASATFTATIGGSVVLTVPAATKWEVQSVVLEQVGTAAASGTRYVYLTMTNGSGQIIAQSVPAVDGVSPTATQVLRCTFWPTALNTTPVALPGSATATRICEVAISEACLGPAFVITGTAVPPASGTNTITIRANIVQVSD